MTTSNEAEVKSSEVEVKSLSEPGAKAVSKGPKVPDILVNPESQAYITASINEAVKSVFASLAPVLKETMEATALTPQKMLEMENLRRAPDPDKLKRELRERALLYEDEKERLATIARSQAACRHKYPTGTYSTSTISNYPDRQMRILCHLCLKVYHPAQWVIGAPDQENPRGRAYIEPETPGYRELLADTVMQRGSGGTV